MKSNHSLFIQVTIQPVPHHRDYQPERSGITNLDQEYHEKLRTSFYHARKYRHKIPYHHPIMTTPDNTDSFDDSTYDSAVRRPSVLITPPPQIIEQRARSPRIFSFGRKRFDISVSMIIYQKIRCCFFSEQPIVNPPPNPVDDQRSALLSVKRNDYVR